MTTTRADIQAMRGIAVLAVLAYHARMPFIKGGYLGVDIFFVVSGYLITGLVARAMRDGRFSFAAFYWRRAWRLLPAAYAVFLACVLVSPWLLTVAEQRDFFKQLLGALTFTGNIALWLQTGYFEQAAELKPLLHVWSLAIEEQYYLLLPAAMALVGPRRWRAAALFATLASVAACFALVASKPGDAFYLLPTRAWELGVGSVAALWVAQPVNLAVPSARWEWLGTLCLVVLAVLVVTPLQAAHPGWATALTCGLTGVIVAVGLRWLGARHGSSVLAWFGDRSYSLYLIHWPIFAFLNSANTSGGGLPWWVRLLAMGVSVALAVLLYRYVESPLRVIGHREVRRPQLASLLGAIALVGLVGALSFFAVSDSREYGTRLRANVGLDPACDQYDGWKDLTQCRTGDGDAVTVWGDSFAMHWVAGLQALGVPLTQWTRSNCPPVTRFAYLARDGLNEHTARVCLGFNAEVMKRLVAADAGVGSVVLLASPWGFPEESLALSATGVLANVDKAALVDALVEQIQMLRAAGRRVVLMAPPLSPGFHVGRCIERRDQLLSFGSPPDCAFSLAAARERGRPVAAFLNAVATRADVAVIDSTLALCGGAAERCNPEIDGAVLYRDWSHLSYEGSVALARRMRLDSEIARLAR